jgi:exonuclease SbcC
LDAQAAAVQQTVASWEQQLRAVTEHPDPRRERRELGERIEGLEAALHQARSSSEPAQAAASHARSLLELALKEALVAEANVIEARRAGEAAALAHGFLSLDQTRDAVRTPTDLQRLRTTVSSFERRAHALDGQMSGLALELGDRRVDAATLREVESELAELLALHDSERKREGGLAAELLAMARRVDRAAALRAEHAIQTRSRGILHQLADNLGTTKFQQYMLRETLSDLVARASTRLYRLSTERYTLELRDDDFFVVDHDNAEERRPATTLSGGETFLASLALALELSEQVQRAAGAIRLDSLFIDEGFASLDHEFLDAAAEAIESLELGGRMVGVVTHLTALTERLPARLLVTKHADGSRVTRQL